MDEKDPVMRWLLEPSDPAVRALALTDVLGLSAESSAVRRARRATQRDPRVRTLLSGQRPDGGFGVHPYQKWTGAHWRLVSLVELGIPPGHPAAVRALDEVLRWLTGPAHRRAVRALNGRVRRCASQEGNALAVASRLGRTEDPRVYLLAESLVEWQWPDGGWNCDTNPRADHSSFHESHPPMWGLLEYSRATGDREALRAADRTRRLFLRHRLLRSEGTGAVVNPGWLVLHYPPYWHYDILQALLLLSRFGPLRDARVREALEVLESRRRPDGRWQPGAYYWRPPGRRSTGVEAVDWGRSGPSKMITLNALRVLRSAGRLPGGTATSRA